MERRVRPSWGALALLIVLFCPLWAASASIVYVNQNTPGAVHDGKSWATAFPSVQPAIDAAASGDEVWVAAGTYTESITLKSNVPLYGGFAGRETARAQRNWKTNAIFLKGGSNTDGVTCRSDGVVIDGFVISGNDWNGVCISFGSATLTNCTITGNGYNGVLISAGSGTLSRNSLGGNNASRNYFADVQVNSSGTATLTDNTISDSGYLGVSVFSGSAILSRNIISGQSWGVVVYQGGTATLVGNTVSGYINDGVNAYGPTTLMNNVISGGDIGVLVDGSTATLTNNTITANANCGVYVSGVAKATLTNNIVAFNAYGLRNDRTIVAGFKNNDVFGNAKLDYLGYNPDPVRGNITLDPLFVDRATGDFHLLAGSPCKDAGTDLMAAGATDLDGNQRIQGAHIDIGAFEIQPQVPWSIPLGTPISGGVTVAERVAYFLGNDGKLYARSTEDGSAVAGFPVDINTAVGSTVKLPSRPAVYYGKTGKAIYLTTDRGDVVRVLPDGSIAWHVRALTGKTVSTPAVTPDGYVYVNLSTGNGPYNNYVFKLDEATGTPQSLSPFLGYTTADILGDFSPAANNSYLYVNSGWVSGAGLTLLNQSNLTIRSAFAGGEQCLSPLLLGSDLVLATRGGKAYKVNAITMNPDLGFGHFGVADIGTQITAAPFADATGNVYLGTTDGRILKWTSGSGSFQPFTSASGSISGLTINRTAGVLGFGTSSGAFVQVPLDNPAGATTVVPGGPISTGTVYDSLTDRFIVVTDTGVLAGYPSIQ